MSDSLRYSTEWDPDQYPDLSDAPPRRRQPRPWNGDPQTQPDESQRLQDEGDAHLDGGL